MRREAFVPLAVACAALVVCTPAHASRATAHPKPKAKPESSKPAPESPRPASAAPTDSGTVLKGGQEGTAFKSLTVEGEDKIQIEFERPPLALDLDPTKAPGLDWGTARDVLDRTVPDLT